MNWLYLLAWTRCTMYSTNPCSRSIFWDESHIISDYRELDIQPNVNYEEELVTILDKQNKVLRRKTIPLFKVLWKIKGVKKLHEKRRRI